MTTSADTPNNVATTPAAATPAATAPVATTLDTRKIQALGDKLRQLTAELTDIFPEREDLINQIVYALLTRENVLIHGIYGTGKTDLVNAVFNAFDKPETFSVALTKFMTEAHVVGLPDPKEMREEGIVRYRREGGILEAELVELDEILDANAPLLRVLLGIFDEHLFKRGRQIEPAKLHTGIASTNGDPEAVVKASPDLGAVIDRFLFISQVKYVEDNANRRKMYRKFVEDKRPQTKINWADLVAVSEIINGQSIPVEDWFIDAFDKLITNYKAEMGNKQNISDRRACKLIKLARASAVLHGRLALDPDDLLAVRWAICRGNEKAHAEAFQKAAPPIIEAVREARKQNVDELSLKLLNEYEAAVPSAPAKNAGEAELLAAYKRASQLLKNAQNVAPQLPSTIDRKEKVVKKLRAVVDQLNERLTQ